MQIHLKPVATLYAVHIPTCIPFAFREQVKEELDSLVQQGIITPAGDKPSEWCHLMVLIPKTKGVCIAVDLTLLNSQVSHPTYPSPTTINAVCNITLSAILLQMHYTGIGRWTWWRKTAISPISSCPMVAFNTVKDQWDSQ